MNFDKKNISEIFNILRVQLQIKEKELLQLQRKDPSLSTPDIEQIKTVVDAIASLQLSTDDESFVFASPFDDDNDDKILSSYVSVCSDDFNRIKGLPMNVWLPEQRQIKETNQQRQTSIFNHLLSLPIETYLSSSWPKIFNTNNNRFPMTNHLLFMPLNTFKPSSNDANIFSVQTNKPIKSFLNNETGLSKECWVKPNPCESCTYKITASV